MRSRSPLIRRSPPHALHSDPTIDLKLMTTTPLRTLTTLLVLLATLLTTPQAAAAGGRAQVLAPGDPPLTQPMVDRVTRLLSDTVGQSLNAQQRDRLRTLYVGYWRARNQEEMQGVLDLLDVATVLDALPSAQRAAAMQNFRNDFLPLLQEAAQTDADARWLVALHEQSQRGARGRTAGAANGSSSGSANAPAIGQANASSVAQAGGHRAVTGAPPLLPAPPAAAAAPSAPRAVAAAPAAATGAPQVAAALAAAPAAGISYTPPPGWTRQDNADATAFDARLKPEPRANHAARITVFKPVAAARGIAAQFDAEWRRIVVPTAGAKAGETVAHFRNRLPGGIDAYFMGGFFELANQTQKLYVVLYVLDLGDRAQSIVATVVGAWDGVGYPGAVDDSAYQALAQSLFPLLDSIQVPGRRAGGPLFAPTEVRGRWQYQDGGYGGSFVSAMTGASMGAAVRGASSTLHLNADGSYRYDFAMYAVNPNSGASIGPQAEGHDGRWDFTDDVITWQPRQRVSYDPRRKVVGGGVQQTPQGARRLLIVASPNERAFKPPMWVPIGGRYDGIMHWYVEDAGAR